MDTNLNWNGKVIAVDEDCLRRGIFESIRNSINAFDTETVKGIEDAILARIFEMDLED